MVTEHPRATATDATTEGGVRRKEGGRMVGGGGLINYADVFIYTPLSSLAYKYLIRFLIKKDGARMKNI